MSCEELLDALNDYVDGETRSALCQTLQEHLADCDPCRIVVDNIRQAIMLYRIGQTVEIPVGFHERLCDVVRRRWLLQSQTPRKPR
jgi:predicted anti-sigma-YlaC factor YlaD